MMRFNNLEAKILIIRKYFDYVIEYMYFHNLISYAVTCPNSVQLLLLLDQ